MFDSSSLTIFITASIALLIIPGPAVTYIVTRSIELGRTAGLVSTLGITSASVVHVIFAALGLSALVFHSALMFSLIKYLGAVYLIYLGLKTIFSKHQNIQKSTLEQTKLSQLFWQGFVINILNPKTALFFLAFLPQFVDPQKGSVSLQFILLGLIFVFLAIISDSLYAILAGSAKNVFSTSKTMQNLKKYFSGFIYMGLGISTALFSFNQNK